MKSGSLRRRLISTAAIWLCIALAAAGSVLRYAFADSVERSFQQHLTAVLRAVAGIIEEGPDGTPIIGKPLGDPRFDRPLSGWYWQASAGETLLRSRSLWDSKLPVAKGHAKFHIGETAGPNGERLMTAERDLTFGGGSVALHVTVAADRREIEAEIRRFDAVLLSAFGILGFGLLAAIALQVRFGLAPLRRLTADLQALRETPDKRLSDDYPSELKPLTSTLNSLMDHDSALLERARAHMGNLAHALKTPLAVLAADIEAGAAKSKESGEQINRLARLIDHHLTRARSEADSARAVGRTTAIEPVLNDVAALLRRFNAGRNLTIHVQADPDCRFAGSAEDLAEMVGNLAENACKWASSTISITASRQENSIVVEVQDDGPGLDEDQLTQASKRGVRLDESAPGHGLGLSIVADLAQLHGGNLELRRSTMGGLAAVLRFP